MRTNSEIYRMISDVSSLVCTGNITLSSNDVCVVFRNAKSNSTDFRLVGAGAVPFGPVVVELELVRFVVPFVVGPFVPRPLMALVTADV
ncbi:hypothetical protein BLOT_004534 [Blomia tropicalis]|nr:hypothetical protein BLOT_004534 [Blomia tropicalis]